MMAEAHCIFIQDVPEQKRRLKVHIPVILGLRTPESLRRILHIRPVHIFEWITLKVHTPEESVRTGW